MLSAVLYVSLHIPQIPQPRLHGPIDPVLESARFDIHPGQPVVHLLSDRPGLLGVGLDLDPFEFPVAQVEQPLLVADLVALVKPTIESQGLDSDLQDILKDY